MIAVAIGLVLTIGVIAYCGCRVAGDEDAARASFGALDHVDHVLGAKDGTHRPSDGSEAISTGVRNPRSHE